MKESDRLNFNCVRQTRPVTCLKQLVFFAGALSGAGSETGHGDEEGQGSEA